jgi:hypothetical protein
MDSPAGPCRWAGRSSATTSSRSVISTVSPALTRRMYSERRALSCFTPTDFHVVTLVTGNHRVN